MSRLMVSISGLRGEIGSTLTPEVIVRYTQAFAKYVNGGKVVLGRDSRVSGPFIAELVRGTLVASGCQVVDIDIVPTPTVQLEIEHHQAAGGIAITASHNPIQWNGLKFMGADGRFLPPAAAEQVYRLADQNEKQLQTWDKLGNVVFDDRAIERHIKKVLSISFIDVEAIKKRRFKVAVDTVNGAGGRIIPQLLETLGCQVIAINQEANGRFAHTPEPLPENLIQLCEAVRENQADLGFAVDPDVDRCAIVDNEGNPIGEEYTLAIAAKLVFSKQLGRMVVNMSTSRASEDIARYYNSMFVRSKVGEINVAEKMKEIDALIGGEGNGGVILPEVHLGRDAPVAVALTLQALLEHGGTMKELKASLPQYEMVKKKVSIEGLNPDEIIERLKEKYKDQEINTLDGLKIDFDDRWVHLRKSNTEPIMRVIAEAPTLKEAEELADRFMKEITQK
ncbi:phosphoglucomutase/phosphomannomutase alpha/beta/alpha domain I [Caldithrix abyssi DSM 13497]|uniref:Phosphomannomutase n=1 Tax=Caldithrix abyssi DSM 13497 TaxID=880073 RepID=H1XQG2_CALAY|nr:phosphoglucosamine mutase [Caldithrix abyssi]APF19960.1 phosphomannomutase [Caldithrix abyssi DSM 13497]EHO40049.1 phosphoglucomutase/phosphomannomutase alpha/beta/alpha domain I [Caldithrix abyssi DSM 13497]